MRGGQYQALLLHDAQVSAGCEPALLAGDGILSVRDVESVGRRSIRRHARRCDVIHAHDAKAHSLAVLHGSGRPVVVARRVAFPVRRGILSQWKYRQAAHFLAVSEHVASILRNSGVPAGKISVVYDAAPEPDQPTDRPHSRAEQGRPNESEFCVVSPQFDDPLKGRDLAVSACQRAGVRLLLSENLRDDLPRADAFLYLTQSEGLGSAILLAMSMGVPVIASAVGGIPEIIDNRKTGLLVDNTLASVSEAVLEFQRDTPLRAAVADGALGRIQTEFSIKRMTERTMDAYRLVLEGAD